MEVSGKIFSNTGHFLCYRQSVLLAVFPSCCLLLPFFDVVLDNNWFLKVICRYYFSFCQSCAGVTNVKSNCRLKWQFAMTREHTENLKMCLQWRLLHKKNHRKTGTKPNQPEKSKTLKQRATYLLKFHNNCVLDKCVEVSYKWKS